MSGVHHATLLQGNRSFIVTVAGSDPYGFVAASFGAIQPNTYIDGGGNTRTIVGVLYNTGSGVLAFRLNGASVPNTDATFVAIIVNGVRYARASASYTVGAPSQWAWTPGSNDLGTSGNKLLVIQP